MPERDRRLQQYDLSSIDCHLQSKMLTPPFTLPEAIKEFSDGDIKKVDNNPALKCYMACALNKADILLIDGTINYDLIQEYINTLPANEIRVAEQHALNTCRTITYTTWCQTGYEIEKCYQTTIPRVGKQNRHCFYFFILD